MFKKLASKSTTMKHIVIPTILMLALLTAFGCGDLNTIVTPQDQDTVLGEVKSNTEVLAAPSNPKVYHGEGLIGPQGGTINIHGSTQVIVPAGALDNDVLITADIEVYAKENKIHYVFGPHGTVFNVPIRLEMSWAYLDKYQGDLELWYLQETGDWTLENPTITDIDTRFRLIAGIDGSVNILYLDDNNQWVLINDVVIVEDQVVETTNSRVIVYIDHFSEYYFPRR
jgi:hypothetical protein